MSSIDYSKSLAALLRESTHEAHELVAKSEGAKLLLSGGLAKNEYIRYLMMLWHVYNAFEQGLDKHPTHPILEPTYNPALLARAPSLSADISYLLQVDESSWKDHPTHKALIQSMPPPLSAYLSRIREVSVSANPSPLLAHSYVRYLGDLSGGQTVRHILAKAYGLDEASGMGVSFYAFKELRSSKLASLGQMKRIKEWFRRGMDAAGEQGVEVKALVIEEANIAFNLNYALLSTINLIEIDSQPSSKEASRVTHTRPEPETGYPISQVLAVIAAICLAHFLLVVGGFTGSKGYQKLLVIEQWFAAVWQQGTTD